MVGLYAPWAIFVPAIHEAGEISDVRFTKRKEGQRKDIERSFGVLQARFASLTSDNYPWYIGDNINSSMVCVIFRNMLIRMNETGCFTQ